MNNADAVVANLVDEEQPQDPTSPRMPISGVVPATETLFVRSLDNDSPMTPSNRMVKEVEAADIDFDGV